MKYAVNIPHFGGCADARTLAALARDAEDAGWDGFFIWDHIALGWPDPVADATVALTAIALNTERIRFGALVTPLPRRRPAKFARETASLDRLSGGRLIVGVGIGLFAVEFENLGEPASLKTRAAMLDEGLGVLTGLWGGEQFTHNGEHYTVRDAHFLPTPVQMPRIPIWVAGMWPNKAPLRRAARWDGVCPIPRVTEDLGAVLTPGDIEEIVAYIMRHRESDAPFDVAAVGTTPGDEPSQAAETAAQYAKAGATWWQEMVTPHRFDWEWGPSPWPMDAMRERVLQGPPKG
jgi:alkanesulfonate monooxygenase SsuD/methylene tetrahydromethanopterin reductase-like flavin-dependent oxidoreductase (luciferase family)